MKEDAKGVCEILQHHPTFLVSCICSTLLACVLRRDRPPGCKPMAQSHFRTTELNDKSGAIFHVMWMCVSGDHNASAQAKGARGCSSYNSSYTHPGSCYKV